MEAKHSPLFDDISKEVVAAVPAKIAREHNAMPVKLEGNLLTFAVTNPEDISLEDTLTFVLNRKFQVRLVGAPAARIGELLEEHYPQTPVRPEDIIGESFPARTPVG